MIETTSHDLDMLREKYKNMKLYKTSDIALASAMVMKSKKLLFIEPVPKKANARGEIFHFVFEDDNDRETIVLHYSTNNPELSVTPSSFRTTMRFLKEQCKNYGTK